MSKIEDSMRFYRKMSDLQEKLRRSEEERLQLEEKFSLLMRACRDEEEIRLNLLREKYETFLEEEKMRKERNERILLTLERIESRANILTAKSERLQLLRRHYEAYLIRMYPKWKYITDKSKAITDQDLLANPSYELDGKIQPAFHTTVERERHTPLPQYDRYGTVPSSYQFQPSEVRTISSAPAVRPFPMSISVPPLSAVVDSKAIYDREARVSANRPLGQVPVIRTQETLLPERSSAEGPKFSRANTQLLSGAERTTELLNVHPDHRHPLSDARTENVLQGEQQLREYVNSEQEQNTSGDLLNVSLSDDGVLHEEVQYTKTDNMVPQSQEIHKKNSELAGGDIFQASSKTSQQMAFNPPSNQFGAGDIGQQRTKMLSTNQKTELQKGINQAQDQSQIGKKYNQDNRQGLQQYLGEKTHEPVRQLGEQMSDQHPQEIKDQLNEPLENLPVTEEQATLKEKLSEHNEESNLQHTGEYTDEHQKQFEQQSAEQYDQQLAGMQEGQSGQMYDQQYPAQYDQYYSEEGQVDQYNFQYTDDGQMNQQYNLQYSEQDQINQQYYEQYPEQYVEENQADQQYVHQYAEQSQLDQEYDQQYLENAPDAQLYQQQYDDQGQFIQDSDQYAVQYDESQRELPEEVGGTYHYSEQEDGSVQYVENQQYSVTAPSTEMQKDDHSLGAQEHTSVEQNMSQLQNTQENNENVQQQQLAKQLQQQSKEQQVEHVHQAEVLQQQQMLPEQQQQLLPEQQPLPELQQQSLPEQQVSQDTFKLEEPQEQNQADIHESQREHLKEADTTSEQQHKKGDEHQADSGDKEPEVDTEEYRRLLGETGEVETSETDELEAQLAELVEPKADSTKEINKANQQPKHAVNKPATTTAEKPFTEAADVDDTSSSDTGGNVPPLLPETTATKLKVETLNAPEKQLQSKEETVTPVSKARPASKRLPVLNKVLESDSESLQLDATVSNAQSDDFDFSSEQ